MSHVPRSITSSDTRRGSSSRSMRFPSKKRPQSAVSELMRLQEQEIIDALMTSQGMCF